MFEWHLICRQPKQRWCSFNPHPMKKQHPGIPQLSQALPQIREIKHFRQQPPLTHPLDSSNSHFSKCWVLIWGLSRPLNPVILTPCSHRHDIPDLGGPLETCFYLLSFFLWLRPPARTLSLWRSFVCFGVREWRKRLKVREEEEDLNSGVELGQYLNGILPHVRNGIWHKLLS